MVGLSRNGFRAALGATLFTLLPSASLGTWSIIMADIVTREIAIGSATCVQAADLETLVPVLVVGKGAAAAQSRVDGTGANRQYIYDSLVAGVDPILILDELSRRDALHQERQYGIADVLSRRLTFTGEMAGQYRGGVTGQFGNVVYALQGNLLAGPPVIDAAMHDIIHTPGDLAEKLMAGMEAAHSMGGDGRCSCSISDPTRCGSPPDNFRKSAHIAFMMVARLGDTDGRTNPSGGYAQGDYFMDLNVARKGYFDPDPTELLRGLFDQWRLNLIGRPDGIQSLVNLGTGVLPNDGVSSTAMTVQLLDWQGEVITAPLDSFTVTHADGSDGVTTIGPITEIGAGLYEVIVTAGTSVGVDTFEIVADDGIRPVTLAPFPTVEVAPEPSVLLLGLPALLLPRRKS